MSTFFNDLRYALRLLIRDGGFAFAALATLALGIGANTAVFSVIRGILLRPLPYEESDRLMFLTEWAEQVPNMSFSVENFKDVRDRARLFESFVAYNRADFVMTGVGEPERVSARRVTSGLFQTFRIRPILGRAFPAEEDKSGAEKVVLLGEGFWNRRFGSRPDVLGTRLTLDNESYTVIGVLPGGMHGSWRRTDIFTPLLQIEDQIGGPTRRGNHPGIYVLGRLKPGVSIEQGRAEIVAIAKGLAEQYPESNARQSMTAESLVNALVGELRPSLMVLAGAVGFVLLIACVNVANLILGRAATRSREMAVRVALGASRARIFRQLLTECVLLSVLGGGIAVLLAYWGISGLSAVIPAAVPRADEIRVDGGVLLFTGVLSVLTGLIFGLAPAWRISRPESAAVLKSGGQKGGSAGGHHRLRSGLVVAEVSLALILLVGAGLMLRSFYRVLHADFGIRPEGVTVAQISLPDEKYGEPEKVGLFIDQMLPKIQAIPGVRYAASATPLLGGWQTSYRIDGRPEPPRGQGPAVDFTRVSPDYFRAMGVDLIRGRTFTDRDGRKPPNVCVIDETFAKINWPGEDPVGRKLVLNARVDPNDIPLEVIGVVRHVKNYGVDQPSREEVYVPYTQSANGYFTLILRTDRDEADTLDAVRAAIGEIDPQVPIFDTGRLESLISEYRASRRLASMLLAIFAGLALLLAAVGIYGVISYNVAQRTQEIGIRMALGAERRQILRMVLGQGTTMATAGILIGLVAAFGLTRLIAALLFQVSATDPPTFSVVPVLLLVVAMAAAYLPARRAIRVEPMTALRDE